AADALFARGEALRNALNALSPDLPMQWTGLGSMMTAHFQRDPIQSPSDVQADPGLRELFFLEMLHRGFYLARRGMIALSLEIGDEETTRFLDAVSDFVQACGPLLVPA
ncbi:MAG: aspartate aminotransferase family protein, partial [Gemmatimonadaceae bacterium]|nr:aspartate aminotransferase family protein [Acetobacteraceae bacterium]